MHHAKMTLLQISEGGGAILQTHRSLDLWTMVFKYLKPRSWAFWITALTSLSELLYSWLPYMLLQNTDTSTKSPLHYMTTKELYYLKKTSGRSKFWSWFEGGVHSSSTHDQHPPPSVNCDICHCFFCWWLIVIKWRHNLTAYIFLNYRLDLLK